MLPASAMMRRWDEAIQPYNKLDFIVYVFFIFRKRTRRHIASTDPSFVSIFSFNFFFGISRNAEKLSYR